MTASTCEHHWIIEQAAGKVSRGVCKECGEEKPFKTSLEYRTWLETRNTMFTGPVEAPTFFPARDWRERSEE